MNKISKKIVALVTMAAFVLTLVPAAAFAAPAENSSVTAEETELVLGADATDVTATVNLDLAEADKGANVIAWVTKDGSSDPYHRATFVGDNLDATNTNNGVWKSYGIYNISAGGQYKISVKLDAAGEYIIHVASNIYTAASPSDKMFEIGSGVKVTVTDAETVVDSYAVTASDDLSTPYTVDSTADSATVQMPNFVANGNNGVAIEATIMNKYADDQDKAAFPIKDQVVTLSSDQVDLYKDKTSTTNVVPEVKTDSTGKVSFYAIPAGGAKGIQTITLSCDGRDFVVYLNIAQEDTKLANIEVVDNGGKLVNQDKSNLSNTVQFLAKNAAGEVIESLDLSQATVRVTKAPTKSTAAFTLAKVQDSKAYGLTTTGTLLEGDYTVHVSLGDKYVDASFTVAKYGKTESSKIVIKDDQGNVVSNVYENGVTYTGTVYVVDENGLEKVYGNAGMVIGVTKGKDAVASFTGNAAQGTFTFNVNDDTNADGDDNALIGTDIEFIAVYPTGSVNATATVTVADTKNIENLSLAFDKESGKVGQSNSVKVTLVNENGDVVKKTSRKAVATVVNKSNEDANVTVNASNITNGEGTLTIFSDKETTVDVLVYVRDSKSSAVYGGTLSYAIGEQDIPVDTSVVMTIGSNDFVVNNDVVNVPDAAPYIANDRTYVPFRALGEAIGAQVEWDQDAQTVTYTLGKTTIVMTIGETTYTVNGEEKTMDVAPEITGDRTYVPVRFVGEALGFKVTALSAADGTTSSVVFQK